MTVYFINAFDINHKQVDYAEMFISKEENFFDKLEETLYILQELTPTHRNWKKDLEFDGQCLFDYHKCQTVIVTVEHKSGNIILQDI